MQSMFILLIYMILTFQLYGQEESTWVKRLFNFSSNIISTLDNTISLSIDAAWLASELVGQTTLTGTLSQDNQGNWSYSSTPSDKLVTVFNDGSFIEFKYSKIQGYTDGDSDDFKESHSMDFTAYSPNYIDVKILSDIGPVDDNTEWARMITGKMIINDNIHTVSITTQGKKNSDIGNGFAFFKKYESVTGTSSSDVSLYQLNDGFYVSIAHNSNIGFYNKDTQIWKTSGVIVGSASYSFQNLNVFYIGATDLYDDASNGIYNKVNESSNWSAEGLLKKNGNEYGKVIFSETPIDGTNGPYLLANINSGGEIILDYLLNPTPTGIKDKSLEMVSNYKLEQNYPNPFNPSTTIEYSIPRSTEYYSVKQTTLKVYDVLGREVATLVNQQQKPGVYSVKWHADNNPSGIYFYRLTVGNFSETRKMILQK